MSKRLKLCSGAEAVQKFKKAGWSAVRQKGSHVMLTKPGYQWTGKCWVSSPQPNLRNCGYTNQLPLP